MDASLLLSFFLNLHPKGNIDKPLLMGLGEGNFIQIFILKNLPEETENCYCEMYTKGSEHLEASI